MQIKKFILMTILLGLSFSNAFAFQGCNNDDEFELQLQNFGARLTQLATDFDQLAHQIKTDARRNNRAMALNLDADKLFKLNKRIEKINKFQNITKKVHARKLEQDKSDKKRCERINAYFQNRYKEISNTLKELEEERIILKNKQ